MTLMPSNDPRLPGRRNQAKLDKIIDDANLDTMRHKLGIETSRQGALAELAAVRDLYHEKTNIEFEELNWGIYRAGDSQLKRDILLDNLIEMRADLRAVLRRRLH